MKSKIYLICSDTDQPFEREILGWSEDKSFLDSEADRLEWEDYKIKSSSAGNRVKILSPNETKYRKYSVQPIEEQPKTG